MKFLAMSIVAAMMLFIPVCVSEAQAHGRVVFQQAFIAPAPAPVPVCAPQPVFAPVCAPAVSYAPSASFSFQASYGVQAFAAAPVKAVFARAFAPAFVARAPVVRFRAFVGPFGGFRARLFIR